MGFETDFFSIDAGVAVIVRWRARLARPSERPEVMIYGGGSLVTADEMVRHLRDQIGTERVDHLVSAHPDPEQTEGLIRILSQLRVDTLWMHPPYPSSGRTPDGDRSAASQRLLALARERNVVVREPLQGFAIGPFCVLSPDKTWFRNDLRPHFAAPRPAWWRRVLAPVWRTVRHNSALALSGLSIEYLPGGFCSPEDESATVLYGEIEGQGLLLTGRAGIAAMEASCAFAETLGLRLARNITFAQLPFGGADHVSSQVLDQLFGPRGQQLRHRRRVGALISMRGMVDVSKVVMIGALAAREITPFAARGRHMHHAFGFDAQHPPVLRTPRAPQSRDVGHKDE